ncbi:amino acid ABC transporter membrane protein 1, PAAT family [Phyllobacterium sp. YR620]|uniref:amino acid ABC transporter permease n=1 Tax=Phyllobacterium sp. YR620 TaxID=1881066 RepID=UPI00088D5FFA|nr:amino acid ABC transporter permease [Phyllobacterium sp. YR620]SDP27697.1 amino acid ABC transporter membrane protein 1, PAAT family [Phyllobacterium sp. YR620]
MAYEMNFTPVLARTPELISGTIDTLILSSQSIGIGLTIGLAAALLRVDGPKWGAVASATYVEAFRNTPLLVQLFLLFFGLPYMGIRLTANEAAIFAISLNLGAYSAEIFRAGLLAIPKTQIEAGLALGLSRLQVMRYVVIIPALRIIYPSLTGQLTLTLLGTSIASAISATELTLAGAKIESQTFRSLETFLVLAAIYVTMTFVFRFLYWLVGLWLFRRRVPKTGSAAATLTLPREVES